MPSLEFHNSTALCSERLGELCRDGMAGWATGTVTVRVRYSRSSDFSGTCFYVDRRIFVNVGRHLSFPYRMGTHLAKAVSRGRRWYKPIFSIELVDAYQLVAFVFMHELYHLLVKRSGRNTRQKESMCDRFAARYVVDRFGLSVLTAGGCLVDRDTWDFQDLLGFVEGARDRRRLRQKPAARTVVTESDSLAKSEHQWLLF